MDEAQPVLWVNAPFLDYFQVTAQETIGNLMQDLGSGQWAHSRLRARMDDALASGVPFEQLGRRTMRVSGTRIENLDEPPRALLLAIEEVPAERDA